MNNQSSDIGQWLRDLITRSANEQVRTTQRFTEILQRVSRGELDQREVQQEYFRFVQEESSRYLGELARLSLSFYSALVDLSRSYNNRLFEQLLSNDPIGGETPAPREAPVQRVDADLHAPLGEDAVISFVVENKRVEPVEITFLISEFTGADGSPAFRPPLQLEPPRFTLRSGEERKVTLRLPLLPDLFLPGVRYNGVVVVRGYEDLVLALTAWADPPVSAEQPAETLVRPHSNGDSIPVHKRNRATRQTQKPQGVEE